MTTAFGFNRRRRASSAMRRVVASSGVWNVTRSQCRATSSNGTKSPPPSRTARGGSQVSTRNPHDAAYLPDVSRADHSQRLFGRMPPVALREVMQYGCDPLQYAAGVAACGRCYADLPAPAVVEVDMVESDGRRGDEPHPRTVEQRRVAARAGADDQRVGVAHVARRYFPARKIAYLGVGFEDPFEKRDGVIDDDFHFSPCIIGTKVGKFERFRIFDSALDTSSRHNQADACFCARLFVSLTAS